MWRVGLLSAVLVTDLVLFIELCRKELRDLRLLRSAKGDPRPATSSGSR